MPLQDYIISLINLEAVIDPVEDSSIIISFAQNTFGYYTNIGNIEQVF